MICLSLQWRGIRSSFDFPNICECTSLRNLPMKSKIALHTHRGTDETRRLLENEVASWCLISYVPLEFLDKVNAMAHTEGESIFPEVDFEFRQSIHTEGGVKWFNLSIDLQMLLTALCVCCHSPRTAAWSSLAKKSLPQVSTLHECWQAGECRSGVNFRVTIGRGIHKLFFHAQEHKESSRECNDLIIQ